MATLRSLGWLDVPLLAVLAAGFVLDPLLAAHGAAIVLIFHAYAVPTAAAALRLAVAALATTVASALHPAPLDAVLVQLPFVYGLSGLVILLMDRLRRTRSAAAAVSAAAAEALGASERRFRQLFRLDPVATAITRLDDNRILDVNQTFSQLTGYARDELVGHDVAELDFFPDREARSRLIERLRSGQEVRAAEVAFRPKSGDVRHVLASMEVIELAGEEAVISSLLDITERKAAEAELAQQALHDHLTGLPNRALLHDRVRQTILAAKRDRTSFSLLYFDLNHFKEINDKFGHAAGDELLRGVARRLQAALRAADTVARMGGDEFVVLLPTAHDLPSMSAALMKMTAALAESFILDGHRVEIRGSFGAVLYPAHGTDAEELVIHADRAMYAAKQSGIDCAVYSPDQDRANQERLELIADLRGAIDRGELVLHYQPCLELRSGRCVAVEALARWPHPKRGLLPPSEFIPLAEGSGLIEPLGRWAVERALEESGQWRRSGSDVRVAVNLSAVSLRSAGLIESVSESLAKSDAHADWLELEITEATAMALGEPVLEVLGRLRSLGVRLTIDDFGTGYSSLAYLQRLPVNALKVDHSFVTDMARNAGNATIVASTIELAHAFNLQVVAEGVEDQATWDRLKALGCDLSQGYLIARPMPLDALLPWLAGRSSGV